MSKTGFGNIVFQVYLYFQSKTQINEESLLYTTLSLFAEIGGSEEKSIELLFYDFLFEGYVGLLLGVAIFHLADLINLFLESKINGYKKRMEEQQENSEEQRSKVYQVNQVMRNDSEQFC